MGQDTFQTKVTESEESRQIATVQNPNSIVRHFFQILIYTEQLVDFSSTGFSLRSFC